MQKPPVAYSERSQALDYLIKEVSKITSDDMLTYALYHECQKNNITSHLRRSDIFENKISKYLLFITLMMPALITAIFTAFDNIHPAMGTLAAGLVVILAATLAGYFIYSSYITNMYLDKTYPHPQKIQLVSQATGELKNPIDQTLLEQKSKLITANMQAQRYLNTLLEQFYQTFSQTENYVSYERRTDFLKQMKNILKTASHYELLSYDERQAFHKQVERLNAKLKLFTFTSPQLENELDLRLDQLKQQG